MANAIGILTLISLLLLSSAHASPFIVAHKEAYLDRLRSGAERVWVSIEIYNQGSSTAYDVSLNDESWPKESFEFVSGNATKSWERLEVGAVVSHSFVLEAKTEGLFHGPPAVITFRIPTKAALQEALSTALMPLDILADRPPEKKFEWVQRLLAKYGSLISVLSLVILFVYLVVTPSKSGAAKGGKKKR